MMRSVMRRIKTQYQCNQRRHSDGQNFKVSTWNGLQEKHLSAHQILDVQEEEQQKIFQRHKDQPCESEKAVTPHCRLTTDENLMRVVEVTYKVIKSYARRKRPRFLRHIKRHNTKKPVLQSSRLSFECCTCVVLFP